MGNDELLEKPIRLRWWERLCETEPLSVNQRLELLEIRRSWVRIIISLAATLFLFFGGPLFIGFLVYIDKLDDAKNLFTTILPIASSIIAFWFAGRGRGAS